MTATLTRPARPVRSGVVAPPRPVPMGLSPAGVGLRGPAVSPAPPRRPQAASRVRACSVREARPAVSRGARPAPTVRLTRRGRLVLLALAVAICAVLFSLGRVSAGAVGRGVPTPATTVVGAGESLWSVASRLAPSSDPREEIERLAKVNGLSDEAELSPGQVLVVPA